MLRSMYCVVLRLHPPAFRNRFGEEILSIFDQPGSSRNSLRLFIDALVSLLRQWALRPEFSHEVAASSPVHATPDGIPCFYTLDRFRPRTAALIHGLVLSTAVFCATCFAIRYSWIRVLNVRIPEAQFESPSSARSGTGVIGTIEEPVAAQSAAIDTQVVPMPALHSERKLQPPSRPGKAAFKGLQPEASSPATSYEHTPGDLSGTTVLQGALPLQSYVGIYVVQRPRRVTVSIRSDDGQLTLQINGSSRQFLVPVSATRFAAGSAETCWVEFENDKNGVARSLRLFQDGRLFIALRQD